MTKERLQNLPLEALQEIANRIDLRVYQNIEREALIEQILEAEEEERSEREKSNNHAMRVKEKKFGITNDDEGLPQNVEGIELPESYNETKIALLLRDPLWAFAYWDLKQSHIELIENTRNARLFLRVYQVDPKEKSTKKKKRPFEIPVKVSDRSWYINLPKTGMQYSLNLVMCGPGKEKILCASNTVQSPEISINPTNDSTTDHSFYSVLAVAGLQESSDFSEKGGIPQRIISLLDTQYLHLQG